MRRYGGPMSGAIKLTMTLVATSCLVAATLLAGVPSPLPSMALDAVWLLHVERVVTGAVAISILITLVVRLSAGQVPLKLGAGSLEFAPDDDGIDVLRLEIESLRQWIEEDRRGA